MSLYQIRRRVVREARSIAESHALPLREAFDESLESDVRRFELRRRIRGFTESAVERELLIEEMTYA